jgi:hypothetical protein
MNRLCCLAVSLAALAGASPALAQDFPSKPIRVIASSAAGGISDIFMRTVGEELNRRWGQPIVIENRAGGGMNIGGRACAEAPPDGTTICILSNEVVSYNQYLYKNPGFDAEKSIAPITNLFSLTQALVVNSSLGVKSLAELAALSKAKPGTLSYSAPAAPHGQLRQGERRRSGARAVQGRRRRRQRRAVGGDADHLSGCRKSDLASAERDDDRPRCRQRAAFASVAGDSDLAGDRLPRPCDALLFCAPRTHGHAGCIHRQDRR